MFHIYFTVRGIHFEMGGIQSESALPGNPPFNQLNNDYDTPSFNEYEQNLEFHQIHTSASKKVIITVSDLCLFMWQILDRKQLVVVPAA